MSDQWPWSSPWDADSDEYRLGLQAFGALLLLVGIALLPVAGMLCAFGAPTRAALAVAGIGLAALVPGLVCHWLRGESAGC